MSVNLLQKIQNICIVGGGVAGMQCLRALTRTKQFDVTLVETSNDFGGVWFENYDGSGLQTPIQVYQFAEYGWKEHNPNTDLSYMPSTPELKDYCIEYAKKFNLYQHAIFNTKMNKLFRINDKNGDVKWKMETLTSNNKIKNDIYDYVVIATGMYDKNNLQMIDFKGKNVFKGKTLHSTQCMNMSEIFINDKDKNCIVIGGSKSSQDIIAQAVQYFNKPITYLIRKQHWTIPHHLFWLLSCKVLYTRWAYLTVTPGYNNDAQQYKFVNNKLTSFLLKYYWKLVSYLFVKQFGYSEKLNYVKPDTNTKLPIDSFSGGILNDHKLMYNLIKSGKVNLIIGEIEEYDDKLGTFILNTGQRIYGDILIEATGFKKEYNYLESEQLKKLNIEYDGMYLYRNILPLDLNNIAFIGSECATFSNIVSFFLQSEWLLRYLNDSLNISKDKNELQKNIDETKNHQRSFIPKSATRSNHIKLHGQGYHDLLCKDMNINHRRKSNWFKEMFSVYTGLDYSNVVNE
eukprot:140079_1